MLCCVLKAGDGSRAGPEEEEAFKIENENRKRRDEREAIKLECPSSIHSSFCRVKRACLYNQPPSVEDNERQTLSLSLFFLLPFAFIKVGITLLVRRTRRRHRNRLSRLQYTFSTSSSLLACLYNQKRKEPRGCVCDASGRRLGTSTRHVHHIDPTTTTTTTTARREKGLYLERRR